MADLHISSRFTGTLNVALGSQTQKGSRRYLLDQLHLGGQEEDQLLGSRILQLLCDLLDQHHRNERLARSCRTPSGVRGCL